MMCKTSKTERVSSDFSKYIEDMQQRIEKDTGTRFSKLEITSFLASQRPTIKIQINKNKNGSNGSIFDF